MKKLLFSSFILILSIQFASGQCDCSTTSGWSSVVSTYPVPLTVSCGYEFITSAKDTINFSSQFNCNSMPGMCNATYKAELKKNGNLVQSFNPFTFPKVLFFGAPGNYSLNIYPICNGKMCSSTCVLYFKVQ